jgi:hypothetical protein
MRATLACALVLAVAPLLLGVTHATTRAPATWSAGCDWSAFEICAELSKNSVGNQCCRGSCTYGYDWCYFCPDSNEDGAGGPHCFKLEASKEQECLASSNCKDGRRHFHEDDEFVVSASDVGFTVVGLLCEFYGFREAFNWVRKPLFLLSSLSLVLKYTELRQTACVDGYTSMILCLDGTTRTPSSAQNPALSLGNLILA